MADGAWDLSALRGAPLDVPALAAKLDAFVDALTFGTECKRQMRHATGSLITILDATAGGSLQQRWERVEIERWPRWDAGEDRPWPAKNWTWGPAALVLSRAIRPGWTMLPRARVSQWLGWLPAGHPLADVLADLRLRVAAVQWSVGEEPQRKAALLGLRLVLAGGYESIGEITDADLKAVPVAAANGIDLLDAVLCDAGVLGRTPQRGAQRRMRRARRSPAELLAASAVPERFRAVHQLYLESYQQRISYVYATTRHKHNSLAHLWAFLDDQFGEVTGSADVRRAHAGVRPARDRARPRGSARRAGRGARRGPIDRASVADRRSLLLRGHLLLGLRGRLTVRCVRAARSAVGAPRPRRRRL